MTKDRGGQGEPPGDSFDLYDPALRRLAMAAAADPKLDEPKVLFLIGAPGLTIKDRARLLAHPSLSTSTLYAFVSGRIDDMPWLRHDPTAIRHLRWGAARHPNSTPQLLMILCGLDDGAYHADILRHPVVTTEIVVEIHRQGLVPTQVACNTKSPEHVLRELFESGDRGVHKALAMNRVTPHEILVDLAFHENRYVRAAVARNRALGRPWLEWLLSDESPRVRENAAKTLVYK